MWVVKLAKRIIGKIVQRCSLKVNKENFGVLLHAARRFNTNYKKTVVTYTLIILTGATFLKNDHYSKRDVEDNIAHLLSLARIALEKGDADRAEAIILMGLKICEDHEIYVALPYMYDILASIAIAQGKLDKAEALLVNVIEKLVQTGVPEDNNHIIDFKLRLARIYSRNRNNSLAEVGFKNCMDVVQDKIVTGDTSARTGMQYVNVLFWYGVHNIRNEKFNDARKLLDTAYDYSSRIKGLSPYQEMVILYTLGDLNLELKDYEVALKYMLNAVLLGKGISSADLPRCYVKLARIYMELGSYEHATISANEGLKLSRLFNNIEVAEEASVILENLKNHEQKM